MKTVYAVTSGEYSDYRVHAIFENEDDAQTHIDALQRSDNSGWGGYDVQAFSFFPAGQQPKRRELWTYVTGGGRFPEKASSRVSWDYDEPEDSWDASDGRVGAISQTLEQAKKAAQDRAARRLAEQHGVG